MATVNEIFDLIPIKEDGQNLLILNKYSCTREDAHQLARLLNERDANFLGIFMVQGPPSEAVLNISIDELKKEK